MQRVDNTSSRWTWLVPLRYGSVFQYTTTHHTYSIVQQFNKALRILFELGSPQDRLLVKYINIGAYNLHIDDGREQRQLTNQEEWSSVVQRGTTIVMRVVMVQQTDEKKYKCPFCEFWIKQGGYEQSSISSWWGFNSSFWLSWFPNKLLHSCSCKRLFHVTPTGDLDATVTNHAMKTVLAIPDYERDLLSNVHLKPARTQEVLHYACHGFQKSGVECIVRWWDEIREIYWK